MKTRCVILAAGLWLAAGAVGRAVDTVRTTTSTVIGEVKQVSRLEIVLIRSGLPQKVPANEIVTIYFDDEPSLMKTARSHLLEGRYQDALTALKKVERAKLDKLIRQDFDFYEAFCNARLALGGSGTIKEAGGKMRDFLDKNADSYRYYQACEVMGQLYVALNAYPWAEQYFGRVATAPWPDYKMRANVAIGRARLAQGKIPEAREAFQAVLKLPAEGDLAKSQHLAATLGMAQCMEDPNQTIKTVDGILETADPEDVELHARAFNTKGTALRKAGRSQEALLAFLHVDVLYFAVPEAHAEALANLAQLWDEAHKTERAVQTRRVLAEQYPNSPWAKRGGS